MNIEDKLSTLRLLVIASLCVAGPWLMALIVYGVK